MSNLKRYLSSVEQLEKLSSNTQSDDEDDYRKFSGEPFRSSRNYRGRYNNPRRARGEKRNVNQRGSNRNNFFEGRHCSPARSYSPASSVSSGEFNKSYSTNNYHGNFRGSRRRNLSIDSGNMFSGNTNFSSFQMGTNRHSKFNLNAPNLAKCLSEFANCEATLLQLFDKYQFHYNHTKQIATQNTQTFEVEGEMIRLRPKLKLCSFHSDHEGCVNSQECDSIHICLNYAKGNCKESDCLFGHMWFTNHNKNILYKYNLNSINIRRLFYLFQKVLTSVKSDSLKVCDDYNTGECICEDCPHLHLCLKFLARQCSSNKKCSLNHTLNIEIKSRLKMHEINLNESPRDIFIDLTTFPSIKESIDSLVREEETCSDKEENTEDSEENIPLISEDTESEEDQKGENKETMWAYDLIGDVQISEICYNSVKNFCLYEESGCWRLHSVYHYYWQAKACIGKKDLWVNLTEEQVVALEKAYCDPSVSKIDLPILNPQIIRASAKGLLLILKGRSKWEADFDTMKLNLVGKSDVLELRRLCTEKNDSDIPEPCKFKWYFLDKHNSWTEYGNADSSTKKFISEINSEYIESEYYKNRDAVINFKNQQFTYVMDFGKMCQINETTQVVRTVRRRPVFHFKEKKINTGLPSFWEEMRKEQNYKRVTLQPSSDEYKKIESLLSTQASGKLANILKIERVQSPYFFKLFQMKVQNMKSIYKNDSIINIQRLFHGTSPDIITNICCENFDWRLHGTRSGQMYGRGTYFATDPSYSYSYAKADANGHRYMFVAKVAVGTVIAGDSQTTRPPPNPYYGVLFDSTVDNVAVPKIIVKYEKPEYYPEYIVTFA